jgi:hypothetical protein
MISSTLPESKKLAGVKAVDAALLYVFGVARATDREGRFEVDSDSLLRISDRFGRAHGWGYDHVATLGAMLHSAGLWIVYQWDGREIAQVVDYHKHNCSHWKERPSEFPPPPGYSDEIERQKYGRKQPEQPSPWIGWNAREKGSTLDEKPGEVKVKVESREGQTQGEPRVCDSPGGLSPKEDAPRRGVDPIREPFTHDGRVQRLLTCWPAAFRSINESNPDFPQMVVPSSGAFRAAEAARAAADAIDAFPTDELLTAELRRVVLCLQERKLTISFPGVVRNLGQVIEGTTDAEPVIWKGAK